MNAIIDDTWQYLCHKNDLIENTGICARFGDYQIAVFYLPSEKQSLYAIENWDPIGKANVLSRGMVGDIDGRLVVASPLYKQHFDLTNGQCIEDNDYVIPVFQLRLDGEQVLITSS